MEGSRSGLLPSRGITPSMEGRGAESSNLPSMARGPRLDPVGENAGAVFSAKRFDVKQGRLVTVLCCTRRGRQKTRML